MKKLIFIGVFLFSLLGIGQDTSTFKFLPDLSVFQAEKFFYVDVPASDLPQSGTNEYYAHPNGSSANDGTSESQSWTLEHAFSTAQAGDLVWVKAGLYADVNGLLQTNDGTFNNAIKFIGYKNTIGDINSSIRSTYMRTDESTDPSSVDMPMIQGNNTVDSIGFNILGDYVSFENFIITNYYYNLFDNGVDCHYKNIVSDLSSRGIHLRNTVSGGVLENFFSLNNGSEAVNIKGNNYEVRNGFIWSDDLNLPSSIDTGAKLLGYYALTGTGATGNLWEGINIIRTPISDGGVTIHGGHGVCLKQDATNNEYRHILIVNTGIEFNYSGVYNNSVHDFEIHGALSTHPSQKRTVIGFLNGAHDNDVFNGYMEDVKYGLEFRNWQDGLPDTATGIDEDKGGDNNTVTNLIVNGAEAAWKSADSQSSGAATSTGNKITDATFYNLGRVVMEDSHVVTDNDWINCNFDTSVGSTLWTNFNSVPFDHTFENCNFTNKSFPNPTGTAITSLSSSFVGPLTDVNGFQLQSNSALKAIGKDGTDIGYQFSIQVPILPDIKTEIQNKKLIQGTIPIFIMQ